MFPAPFRMRVLKREACVCRERLRAGRVPERRKSTWG